MVTYSLIEIDKMIFTTHKAPIPSNELYAFLSGELMLTDNAIKLGIKQSQTECAPISIILWNLGLINLEQYQKLLDWLIKQD